MFAKLIALSLLMITTSAFAQRSEQLGRRVYLNDCGGYVTLNESSNGDLSIQLHNVDTYRCYRFEVSDASSGRVIRSYNIQGTSYTLSREMLRSLSTDCRLNFEIGGRSWSNDSFFVYVPWCSRGPGGGYWDPGFGYGRITYEWSNAGNCKKMIDGVFSGQLVDDSYCGGRGGRGGSWDPGFGYGRITYEWSNAGNCKKMIDGVFSGQLVDDSYCGGRYGGGRGGYGRVTYEWSNAGNCKKMVDGRFTGELVAKSYCRR